MLSTKSNLVKIVNSYVPEKVKIYIEKNLLDELDIDANDIINKLATHIEGSGGGQKFLATAGGKNKEGIKKVINEGRIILESILNK